MIQNMFQIPFLQLECNNWDVKKQKLLEIPKDLFKSVFINTDYFNNQDYTHKVSDIFTDEMYQFQNILGIKQASIKKAWFELAEKHDYHGPHTHGAVGYSAVCYINYHKSHTPTKFIAPFKNWINGNDIVFSPSVQEGTIIFFPSALLHYTEANNADDQRLIISFNIDCK